MDIAVVVGVLGATLGGVGTALAAWRSVAWSSRAEKNERDRLIGEILAPKISAGDYVEVEGVFDRGKDVTQEAFRRFIAAAVDLPEQGWAVPTAPSRTVKESPERIILESDTIYDRLLINDYALGLTQARRTFNVSTVFSILGGFVLVMGVSLAIFRADTGGQVAGAIITSSAGVLTSGLSQLFRGQSAKALKHLEAQATELRTDVRAQTNAANALRLLHEVSDKELLARLQAALILKFSGAVLPDLGGHPMPGGDPNGNSNRNSGED
jgi:hypothetical protein